jgi:hypothetical protein
MANPISRFLALDVDSDGDVYGEKKPIADRSRVWSSEIKDSNRRRVASGKRQSEPTHQKS